ncbi:hypothetical protein PGT21_025616 [Puccinia graminis f. sp. tritici]|uniref:Uncharacterized protein n=3 Tax=Puccinia graminis f. sp. tritici TaxID=56615 RepID=E3K831_PUCGT|nr:uncharacterized protein PGTG_06193 [Puccinia graminis f. sp. tritici CRL 75-36-700-3]EFP80237.2 hypothetical protein PGTG_06193 [Puccinia graminis f. sp. tritici CRL 75-36-700-3]KAA1066225.1 hypothetical protein PGT21_025616 [Puccinia graminis f. sp. tritici]KAA1072700.1 hypothetical protein PGTUg99_019855 [Puccinia graminis f. sp. tritici]KAA1095728.1 hypothetical protein PGTUg99_027043 [Puccinia graminis f. sp. tritici]
MKTSFPCIFLITLTTLLANRAVGLLGRSAKVTAVSWPKQWVLPPHRAPPPEEFRLSQVTTLPVWKTLGLRFYPGDVDWSAHNQLNCEVTIRVHFKAEDGQRSSVVHNFASDSGHGLNIPHSTELTVDVVSVGGMH